MQGFKALALPWYTDQILPFDMTMACANEYGAAASAKVFGIEILNEGFGTSIDDSVMEAQATFVARTVSPLQGVGRLLAWNLSRVAAADTRGCEWAEEENFSRVASPLIVDDSL